MKIENKDYKKLYEEALERAKIKRDEYMRLDGPESYVPQDIEYIFPELKESEDERIRKAIVNHLLELSKSRVNLMTKATYENWITWLKKQGSNLVENGYTNNKDIIKYADKYSHAIWLKLMDNFKNIKDYYIGCNDVSDIVLNAIIDAYNWLEKQGEQSKKVSIWKHLNKGIGIVGIGDGTPTYLIKNGTTYSLSSCISSECDYIELSELDKLMVEKQGNQKPNFCHHEVDLSDCSEQYRKAYYDGWNNCNQQHAQLEAEQKPAWSEDDEKMLRSSRCYLNEYGNWLSSKNEEKSLSVYKACDWLKSLKDRITITRNDNDLKKL